jgi:hypothetical protein
LVEDALSLKKVMNPGQPGFGKRKEPAFTSGKPSLRRKGKGIQYG